MKKIFLLFSILWLSGSAVNTVQAQDIHFSQFYENAILRNPALTGIFSGDYKAGVNYRTQWSNISVPFQTALASAESRISLSSEGGDFLSYGVCAAYDRAGSINFNSFEVYPAINYNKFLEDKHSSYLSVGFTGGYIQRSVDMNKMTFSSQYINGSFSSSNPTGENQPFKSVQNYDLGAGISLNSSLGEYNQVNYYIGAAAYHITKPSQTFTGDNAFIRLNTRWSGNFGLKYSINPQVALTFHFNYTNQAPYQETIGGGMVSWKSIGTANNNNFIIYGGLFYRMHDAMIPTVKIDYLNYSLTLSYDVNNSSLKPATQGVGGFEISLYIRGYFKKAIKATDATKCPRFEDLSNPGF
ncbi:MAG TPA: PorP/SprF family type IX secretion system membrane protein [Flavipsychrobacter sp.]|nr:PorP/SprF family type IX secretion system membrane protein [Flavipsychrobacter sp.]